MEKTKYLGHIIDKDGRRSDPERATTIEDMSAPDNIASLQSFLGLANYYQIFIQNMHDLCCPLNELSNEYKPLDWTAESLEAFEKIKKTLTSESFLPHYNPDLEIIVARDASSYVVGLCTLHKMTDDTLKPIPHASRALLPAEKNYSQIEKEALWIIIAVSLLYLPSTLHSTKKP